MDAFAKQRSAYAIQTASQSEYVFASGLVLVFAFSSASVINIKNGV